MLINRWLAFVVVGIVTWIGFQILLPIMDVMYGVQTGMNYDSEPLLGVEYYDLMMNMFNVQTMLMLLVIALFAVVGSLRLLGHGRT